MSETRVTTDPVPSHQHTPTMALVPSMCCEDCAWKAGSSDAGWLACQAVEHVSHNPGHRVSYHDAEFGVFGVYRGSAG